jgi:hypothetical protein
MRRGKASREPPAGAPSGKTRTTLAIVIAFGVYWLSVSLCDQLSGKAGWLRLSDPEQLFPVVRCELSARSRELAAWVD